MLISSKPWVVNVGLFQVESLDVFDCIKVGHNLIPVSVVKYNLGSADLSREQVSVGSHRPGRVDVIGNVGRAWPVPLHVGELSLVGLLVDIEIVVDSIKVRTRGTVKLWSVLLIF